jgi:hypothetical protein
MQKSFLYLLVIIGSLFFTACEPNSTQSSNKEIKDPQGVLIPDTIFSDNYGYALRKADKTCLADTQRLICEFGVTQIAILGFPMDELILDKSIRIKDTLYIQGGYQWRGQELALTDGSMVYLEGNFVDEGDPGNQLPISIVNRIRVESSQYETVEGIKVGMPFSELKQKLSEDQYVAIYIPSVGMVDITLPELSGLHFNVPLNVEVDLEEGYQGKEISTQFIPDSAQIHSIVVAF